MGIFSGCKLCSAGRFNSKESTSLPITSDAECEPCEAGMYGEETGCVDKDPMVYSQIDSLEPARFCNKSCAKCPIGRYSTTVGASTYGHCLNCSVGRYNELIGSKTAVDCKQCPEGYYQSLEAKGLCIECAVGQFTLCDTPGVGDAGPLGGCTK